MAKHYSVQTKQKEALMYVKDRKKQVFSTRKLSERLRIFGIDKPSFQKLVLTKIKCVATFYKIKKISQTIYKW